MACAMNRGCARRARTALIARPAPLRPPLLLRPPPPPRRRLLPLPLRRPRQRRQGPPLLAGPANAWIALWTSRRTMARSGMVGLSHSTARLSAPADSVRPSGAGRTKIARQPACTAVPAVEVLWMVCQSPQLRPRRVPPQRPLLLPLLLRQQQPGTSQPPPLCPPRSEARLRTCRQLAAAPRRCTLPPMVAQPIASLKMAVFKCVSVGRSTCGVMSSSRSLAGL
mmetsp:Transcript_13809/g.34838  ORF Transcript_13809/g.34838 Transcript_13809/m.34838 type:complete len:224 (-) Transcript_13809:1357-2028(-)